MSLTISRIAARVAASRGLRQQNRRVLGKRTVFRKVAGDFPRNDRDRAQRRPQLMGRGGAYARLFASWAAGVDRSEAPFDDGALPAP